MPYDERDARKKAGRVQATDALMDERHRGFDLAAQDKTPKSARHHFAVVGEGSRESQAAYRRNYSLIDWRA